MSPVIIDEDIAHDPVHPTVEPSSLLPLVAAGQSALYGHLAQIVAVGRRTGKADREPPQSRQQLKRLLFEASGQRIVPFCWMKRLAAFVSSMLKVK